MNFKDSITKSINQHMSTGGIKRAERDSKLPLYVPDYFHNPELSVNKFTEMDDSDKIAIRVITQLTDELVNSIVREFERNAIGIMSMRSGKITKAAKLREAFKKVDADMICSEHNKITCKTCFGPNFERIPFDRTVSDFKKANEAIWSVFTNTREEIEFLQDLVSELKGEQVDNPTVLDNAHGMNRGYDYFARVYEFKHDNKNGFVGMVKIPDYIYKVVFELYFDDGKSTIESDGPLSETELFEKKRLTLAVEVETIFRSLVNAWVTYLDKNKGNVNANEWLKLKVANEAA
ncbi:MULTISPECIES: hypothetical protein [Pseudomonas]|uniref:hypothetical protein n=1 Tax=Pseudomonas TaxID=286 RepID=UPI000760FC13|nr:MULTISPECIES: hypothetical protein [Pseudomonas]EKV1241278.1 hypothetical protein [Pseudomonas aeruginosa]EKV8586187.1 hypothetical protein [Pseudomonas aeruginosa]ELN5407405.1 hypothetical protein [Pseudomonas aeruginosa]ELP1438596.1 hypothetical protein [Pseudomonas aeruginosa]THB16446.1 hypothetical protein E6W26_29045 [Pseudomonas aeruginosa]